MPRGNMTTRRTKTFRSRQLARGIVGGGREGVRPVKLKDLPRERQAEARRLAGVPSREYRPKAARVSTSIPASWTDHRKSCGYAGSEECPYCGDEGEQSMYKAMHQSMRSSEKLAELSDFAFRVWEMGVVASDVVGRITANPRKFHAEAFPLLKYEEAKLVAAFNELKATNLAHFYDVDGKPYMVFHDHDEHNKSSKNLKHSKTKTPPPPPSLCYCVTYTKEEEGASTVATVVPTVVATTDVHVHVPVHDQVQRGSGGDTVRILAALWNDGPGEHLNGKSAAEKIQAAMDVGLDPKSIEQAFWDHKTIKGQKIWEVLDPLRDRLRKSPVDGKGFRSIESVCHNCGGSGVTVAGPCPGCKKGRELRSAQA